MKKLIKSICKAASIVAPVAKVEVISYEEEYVVLPIKEPWASMIADGIKPFEFRGWIPTKWPIGKKILIVATGKAKSPREIIAVCDFKCNAEVIENENGDHIVKGYQHLIPEKDVYHLGGFKGDNAIVLENVKRIEPILLSDLGIKRTPQKYQYWTGNIDNFTKWNVNK